MLTFFYYISNNTICFGFKKTNKEILTTGGEIMNLFFQESILQTKFRSKIKNLLINWYILYKLNYFCKYEFFVNCYVENFKLDNSFRFFFVKNQ